MTEILTEHQHRRARAIAKVLEPLIAAHLDPTPAAPPVVAKRDGNIVAAAARVSEAVTKLLQVKYTRAEIRARSELERAAIELRDRMKRGKANVR